MGLQNSMAILSGDTADRKNPEEVAGWAPTLAYKGNGVHPAFRIPTQLHTKEAFVIYPSENELHLK